MSEAAMNSVCVLILIVAFMYINTLTIADKNTVNTQNNYTVINNNTNTTL